MSGQAFVADQSTYVVGQTYDENYDRGPRFDSDIPQRPSFASKIRFLGFEVNSPLGVPAGPLLNAKYTTLYAKLGFDIVTYKTVRSVYRKVHPAPNCVYVDTHGQLRFDQAGGDLTEVGHMPLKLEDVTITNSFGMPCKEVAEWQADVAKGVSELADGQMMVVSVVGTPGLPDRDMVEDFAYTAGLAKEAGAHAIEANFSCPNVCTGEGSIYTDPDTSAKIAKKIREQIGPDLPLILKVGYLDVAQFRALMEACNPYVNAYAGINTISMKVHKADGSQALPGEGRLSSGLCGAGIHDVSLEFAKTMVAVKKELGADNITLISVGGITTPEQFDERLATGVDAVMSATGAMWDPLLAYKYHKMHANG